MCYNPLIFSYSSKANSYKALIKPEFLWNAVALIIIYYVLWTDCTVVTLWVYVQVSWIWCQIKISHAYGLKYWHTDFYTI